MSKYQFQQSSIYQLDSDLPKNKLSIQDALLLEAIEIELLESAYQAYASLVSRDTVFDLDFYIGLHRNTFSSLYDWAGVIRTEDMSKGGSLFCRAQFLPKELNKRFTHLARENYLRDAAHQGKAAFAQRVSFFQCELICLHPFYELNGRVTRLFFDLIALANGYQTIDYSEALMPANTENLHNHYIQASIDCVQFANTDRLYQIILNGLHYLEGTPS